MTFFNSLTRKFILVSLILLFFLSVFIYSVFHYTQHLRNEAARINVISQLRFRSFEMAWLVQRIIEQEVSRLESQVRRSYIYELRHDIDQYEQLLGDLKQGNKGKGLDPMYEKFMPLINKLALEWSHQRLILIKVTELPADTEEKVSRDLLQNYDAAIREYVREIDMFAGFIEEDYRDEIRELEIIMLCILGIFSISAVFFIVYTRHFVVKPIKLIRDSAREIEKGNFGVRVDVKTSDELGELSKAFNMMALRLTEVISAAEKRAEDILALNIASNNIIGMMSIETLYKKICESILKIYDLKLVWLGLIQEGSFAVKPVASAGEAEGYLSDMTLTWDEKPTGSGPAGLAIKKRCPQMVPLVDTEPSFAPWLEQARKFGIKSVLAAPLICPGNEVIGVICIYSDKPGYFSAEMIELLQIYANQAAALIDNSRMVEDLENTVIKRTCQFEDARMIAESANLSKSNFIANMSHELRTPLNVIIGFSEALSAGIYGEINSEHAEYIRLILKSGLHLLSLVDSILELTTMDTGTMVPDYSECSIRDVLQGSLYMFTEKAKKHRLDLHVELGEGLRTFVVDQNKIRYVLVTLLTNALNNSPEGGTVGICARRVTKAGIRGLALEVSEKGPVPSPQPPISGADFIEIAVHYTGPAISAEQQENLFIPFDSAESPLSGSSEVLKINLALCKRFIEVHGGNIWIESLPSEGLQTAQTDTGRAMETGNRFVFVLPMRPSGDKIIIGAGR